MKGFFLILQYMTQRLGLLGCCVLATAATMPGGPVQAQSHAANARTPEVWFAPNDDLPRPSAPGGYLNHDFPHLFEAKPAWDPKIDVFKISLKMGSTIGPAEELTRISAFLRARHIALAVSVGTMLMDSPTPVTGECGFGVEGSNRPGRNAEEAFDSSGLAALSAEVQGRCAKFIGRAFGE
jgi:hypothetical protein